MSEDRETRLRRLTMRSMRRGTKEMDLILQAFAADALAGMTGAELDIYDALLSEADPDIYGWILGKADPPPPYGPLIARIAAGAHGIVRPA